MKQQQTSSLRKSVTFSIVMTMFILIVVVVVVTDLIHSYNHEEHEQMHTEQVQMSVEKVIEHYIVEYNYIAKRIIKTTALVELLKKKDRETVYKLFKKKWDLMREEEPFLKAMHFHLKDGTSFLRMHRPEMFGDNLIDSRAIIKEAHNSRELISGYETGKLGSLYRIITPIYDANKIYIGALELGLDLNFIIRELNEINNMHGLVFIKDDKLTFFNESNDLIIDGYKLLSQPEGTLAVISKALTTLNFKKHDVTLLADDKRFQLHVFTLNDYQDQAKIKIIIFHDSIRRWTIENYLLTAQLALISISLILLIWFVHNRIKIYEKKVTKLYDKQLKQIDESEKLLVKSQEITHIGSWKLDIVSNKLFWSDEIYKIFEIDRKEFEASYDYFLDSIYPDDRDMVNRKYLDSLKNRMPYSLEHRLLMKDGRIKFVMERCESTFDANGNALVSVGTVEDITKQKELQYELEFNQEYLQNIIDGTSNIIIVTDGEDIKRANRTMLKFTGFDTLEAFKEKHDCICDFFVEGTGCLMPAIKGATWLDYIISKPTDIHEVCMINDGKLYRFIVQVNPLDLNEIHRSVVTFTDVTEIESIKEKLASNNKILLENEKKFQAITSSALDAIIMLDNRGRLIFWNPKAKEMLGYEDKELMGEDFHKVVAPKAFHEAAERAYEKFAISGEGAVLGQILELSAIKKGGAEFPISLILSGVHIDGKWHGIGFMRDITEKKELESELKQKDEIMLAQSRQAAMGDMISMIAHQWRQPITAIGMGAQNIQLDIELEDIDLERFNQKLDKIVEQTHFLSKTIDDFRNFLKPNNKPKTSRLSEILDSALSIVDKSLQNNNITLEKSCENDIEIVTFDNELIQVLLNIINNAKDVINIKEIDGAIIWLSIGHDEEMAYFKICDNAGGVPKDILPRIFEPYFSTKEEKGGTGLGLYMSKMIIEKHLRGIIKVENSSKGACFTILIPMKEKYGL